MDDATQRYNPDSDQSLADRQAEAVRVGAEDQSAQVGADIPKGDRMASGSPPVAGDPDAMAEQAKMVGEEAIGGTTPTPDQDVVDDIGEAVGVQMDPDQPVEVTEEMRDRDRQRWELDPESEGRPSETRPFNP
ncbi:hypothetical protein C7271_19715 [filamentous cyanobacterium CCP5]|nr:hypothetical protein C7271_19715 [filamentous cyanobacterium CCP5]